MRAIVLHSIPYTDSSRIVRIFTEEYGLRAYLIRGVGKKRSGSSSLLQPLSLVDITERERHRGDLYQLADHKRSVVLSGLITDPYKSMLAMFMAELVQHFIAHEHAHPELFDYLWNSVQMMDLDQKPGVYAVLLAGRMIKFLGVTPDEVPSTIERGNGFLNLSTGRWEFSAPIPDGYAELSIGKLLRLTGSASAEQLRSEDLSRADLRILLDAQVRYLQLHINDQRPLKSLPVLREVFS